MTESGNEPIVGRASRRGREWTVHLPEHGVYGHGRTLAATRTNVITGLALVGVTADVTLFADSPELEALRSAREAYAAALSAAVKSLALRRTTLGDIASATEVPRSQVKRLRTEFAPPRDPFRQV
ncbi:hypothetical protein ACIQNG_25730 [Streptomyces sp. NPDC091377]|uniref:hypothetical protein n=1 Tax=Streptomyces sp. NPDC091377 TaxID=3365995 RepID=UPI00382AB45B